MSKEEFLEILSRQQRSGLTIKDFCVNEDLTSPSTSTPSYDRVAMGSGEIRIEFPGGIIARFSGMAESHAAMQLLTQICGHHVLPE